AFHARQSEQTSFSLVRLHFRHRLPPSISNRCAHSVQSSWRLSSNTLCQLICGMIAVSHHKQCTFLPPFMINFTIMKNVPVYSSCLSSVQHPRSILSFRHEKTPPPRPDHLDFFQLDQLFAQGPLHQTHHDPRLKQQHPPMETSHRALISSLLKE